MRATVLSPGASALGTSCCAHQPSPTATAPSPGLSPSYPSPSPLSLLPVLTLCLPDSNRRKCGFHLGFGLETFRLASSAAEFEKNLQHPRAFANRVGAALAEYLVRVLSHRATLTEPRDLAVLLASYARDGLARVEASGDQSSMGDLRSALEEALGIKFEGEKGEAFFRSTLVQTLFYGGFSAWVLWARQPPTPAGVFNWHETAMYLRVPVLQTLFEEISKLSRLQPLHLVEILDWTAAALDRVDREAFFDKFNEGEAVPYFCAPFLEAFDPDLRKQLGVWYTPAEVVRYMVARVDRSLKDDLGIEDGLAAENVYVLDRPCMRLAGAFLRHRRPRR